MQPQRNELSAADTDDSVASLSQALRQLTAVAATVARNEETLPTPCRSWDVHRLLVHTIQTARNFAAAARGEAAPTTADLAIGDAWLAELLAAEDALMDAWRQPGALDRTVLLPWGEQPATWRVGQQTVEFTVHGWDLAHALGRDAELHPGLAELALEWGKGNLKPEFRGDEASGKVFGIEVPVPADAPPYARLAGFFGRDPG
jgi:uncharacterized protein (TIGR03086 family)